MRTRATRVCVVVALAAGTAMAGATLAGAAAPLGAIHPVLHEVSRAVVVPAHGAEAVSPSRVPGGAAHVKAATGEASLALAALLVLGLAGWLRRSRGGQLVVSANSYGRGCRAPPSGRL